MGLFDVFKKKDQKKEFDGNIYTPLNGKIVPLETVPDEVFAGKMVGDGIAIEPNASGVMVAPVDGKIEKIFDTNHSFSIVTESGIEVLVHFGVDTVALEGKGFERLAKEGDTVKRGTPIVKYDYEYLKANAKSILTPVLITNYTDYAELDKKSGNVVAGETVVLVINEK